MKADSRFNEKVEGSRYIGVCGTSVGAMPVKLQQLALSCKARPWLCNYLCQPAVDEELLSLLPERCDGVKETRSEDDSS